MKRDANWKLFPKGTKVAHRTRIVDRIHQGIVTKIQVLPNGFPRIWVNFPTWKGEIEIHPSFLCIPDQYEQNVNWWAI